MGAGSSCRQERWPESAAGESWSWSFCAWPGRGLCSTTTFCTLCVWWWAHADAGLGGWGGEGRGWWSLLGWPKLCGERVARLAWVCPVCEFALGCVSSERDLGGSATSSCGLSVNSNNKQHSLVFCPAALRQNPRQQTRAWVTAPHLPAVSHSGFGVLITRV